MPDQTFTYGPYKDHKPASFAIDAHGYAWAVWPDESMSMVVSTTSNLSALPFEVYRPTNEARRLSASAGRCPWCDGFKNAHKVPCPAAAPFDAQAAVDLLRDQGIDARVLDDE